MSLFNLTVHSAFVIKYWSFGEKGTFGHWTNTKMLRPRGRDGDPY